MIIPLPACRSRRFQRVLSAALAAVFATGAVAAAESPNWYMWRGPNGNGTSLEHYEDFEFVAEPVWTKDIRGGGTPVIVDGRVFSFGYKGEREDLVELITAHDAKTGEIIWQDEIQDFISDTAYNRYSIGAATVDPETKNVYLMATHGVFRCYTFDGEKQWEISLMERFGRLTFPNGRAGCPVVEGELVIVRGITAYWGAEGPARDRFYAFDKTTGELVWSSTPGVQPQDSSFSTPVFETRDGKRVFYAGTGCGNVVCVNARDGKPIWRFQMSAGGVNSSPVIFNDTIVAIHGVENIDTSEEGRMVAIRVPKDYDVEEELVLGAESEVWRNPLNMFSSSPALSDGRVYQITKTGTLACVDAATGKILWNEKLAADNLHSSPLWADGVLYVPMNDGTLHVMRPDDSGPNPITTVELAGNCLGAPAIWNGHLFVHTKAKLYCFQLKNSGITHDPAPEPELPAPGEAVALQVVPTDVLLKQGDSQKFRLRKIDANGFVVDEIGGAAAKWEEFIPPSAKVRATVNGSFSDQGELVVAADARPSAGAFKAEADGLTGILRARTLPALPYVEDFERFELDETASDGAAFSYPPLPWIGARFKFDIREMDGGKVFAKTLDNILFQRATAFIGDPNLSSYTLQADVRTEGNRRKKMDVGVVNQRYLITLQGNYNQIEISSNQERLKRSVPFPIRPDTWYTLKTRVDTNDDGSGVIRVKAWERDVDEPADWNFELEVPRVHAEGAPGLYGFALQNQMKVYIDNVRITPNEE